MFAFSRAVKVLSIAVLFFGAGVVSTTLSSASTSPSNGRAPVFLWLFGYTGQYFLPQYQLHISPAKVVSVVQNIARVVGKSNLNLVSVVGEEPAQPPWGLTNVNWSNRSQVSVLKSFVETLRSSAAGVYARLDFQEFNATVVGGRSIFSEVSNFTRIGVNGFWFDHGPNLYNLLGESYLNSMMQNLSRLFPTFTFLLNDAVSCPAGIKHCIGWISPLSSDTWQYQTFISPSIRPGSFDKLDMHALGNLSKIYPNRVVLHFDAYSEVPTEPMGLFAVQSSSVEVLAVQQLVSEGNSSSLLFQGYPYYFMFPVLGAATYNGPIGGANYYGTLYNSLSFGKYHRSTEASFQELMG